MSIIGRGRVWIFVSDLFAAESANMICERLDSGLTSFPGTFFRHFLDAHSGDDFWQPHLSPAQYQSNNLHCLKVKL